MIKRYRFFVQVHDDGSQIIGSFSHSSFTRNAVLILDQNSSVARLNWFRGLVVEAFESKEKKTVWINTLVLHIHKENCQIGYEGEEDEFDTAITSEIIQYIDDAIIFVTKYENGDIPGLIPSSFNDAKSKT